jgi:hypothetical protein
MIMAAKVINMPTICLKFRFKENQKVKALMAACASIQQQAVDFAIDNNKTARGVKTLGGKMLPRQGLVGDPCCLSSGFGLRAQSHDRNTQFNCVSLRLDCQA